MKFDDFEAFVFDLDGTLVDSMMFWRLAAVEEMMTAGYSLTDEDFAQLRHRTCAEIMRAVIERAGEDASDLTAHYEGLHRRTDRHYRENVRCKPGAEAFLDRLTGMGKRLFVATATPMKYAVHALERTGIGNRFEWVTDVSWSEGGKGKPEFYHRFAEKIGVPTEKCIMFEDAPYSIRSAKEAGWTVVAVEEGIYEASKEEIQALADLWVRNFEELLEG